MKLVLITNQSRSVRLIRTLLQEANPSPAEIIHINNLPSARSYLESQSCDVIMVDPVSVGMTGLESVPQLTEVAPTVPVLVLAKSSDEALEREALRHGAQDIVIEDILNSQVLMRILAHAIERIRFQNTLREREERLRTLTAASFEGIVIHDQGTVLEANLQFSRMAGYTPDEIAGRNILDFAAPESHNLILESIKTGREEPYEVLGLHKDGNRVPCELRGKNSTYKGRQVRVVSIRDLSARKRSEIALRKSEEKFRILSDESPNIIFINQHGRVVYTNRRAEEIMGYTREEVCSPEFDFLNLIAPESRTEVRRNFERHQGGEEVPPLEYSLITRDGRKLRALHSTKIIEFEGQPAILGIITDVTEHRQAEEQLRYQATLMQNIGDPVISIDMDYIIKSWNPVAEKVYGWKAAEACGKNLVELLKPSYLADSLETIQKTFQETGLYQGEVIHYHKNGTPLNILSSVSLLKDAAGKPTGAINVNRDITHLKRIEGARRIQEEKYRTIFESFVDLYFRTDTKGVLTVVSPSVRNYGYEPEQLIGQPVAGYFQNPGEVATLLERLRETGEVRDFEMLLLTSDGKPVDASANVRILRNLKGEPLGMEGVLRDISDRKQAFELLKTSEQRFRSLFEDSHDPIYMATPAGQLLDINQAGLDLFGYTREEFKKLNTRELYAHPTDRKLFLKQITKNGFVKDYEVVLRKMDGSEMTCLLTASVRKQNNSAGIMYQGIIHDITERVKAGRELEEALRRAEKADEIKTLFLANMSHEIRTPLNAILGFTDLIEISVKDKLSEEEQSFFETLRHSGERLMNTVHEILDISAIETGTFTMGQYPLDLLNTIQQVVEDQRPAARAKGLQFDFNTSVKRAVIQADEYCIHQALTHLVDNAIKYTQSGRIVLELKAPPDKLILTIRDTGIGMSPEYQEHLFEVFSQESTGYTKRFQGVGLGLALTKRYLDLNQARISVHSRKNSGTTFTLQFKSLNSLNKDSVRDQ